MSLSIAIVGLPNVGKSTLFNALLKRQAALAANYPFATIEPNVGIVPVPDDRLDKLAEIVNSNNIKPATVEFVDIAGLVRGASKGEGLGNQFLANIRECAVVCHVLRAFQNDDIIREGSVSPEEDLATVRTELQLKDLETLEKQKEPKGKIEKVETEKWQAVLEFKKRLAAGENIGDLFPDVARELGLLTSKAELFVLNVGEEDLAKTEELSKFWAEKLAVRVEQIVIMCNQVESEVASLGDEDATLYLAELGLTKSGLERLIKAAYTTLGLQSFLTAGEKEVRAWTIKQGTFAPQAAGVIHTDFEKKFIKAKIASYDDFVAFAGWKGVKEAGKMRLEGKDYVTQEGDVVEFMIGS